MKHIAGKLIFIFYGAKLQKKRDRNQNKRVEKQAKRT